MLCKFSKRNIFCQTKCTYAARVRRSKFSDVGAIKKKQNLRVKEKFVPQQKQFYRRFEEAYASVST